MSLLQEKLTAVSRVPKGAGLRQGASIAGCKICHSPNLTWLPVSITPMSSLTDTETDNLVGWTCTHIDADTDHVVSVHLQYLI